MHAAAATDHCAGLPEPVTWVVPNTAGSSYDVLSRMLQPPLEARLGRRVVVANVAGAGGRIGTTRIANGPQDGSVVGIVNAVPLLVDRLLGRREERVASLNKLTLLARVNRVRHVWAVAKGRGPQTLAALLRLGRPVVAATRDVSSSSFYSLIVASRLVGLAIEIVPGYASNRDARLAVLRGEVDVASMNFASARNMLAAGELQPVLQIAATPIDATLLEGVPLLAGPAGIVHGSHARPSDAAIAARRATALVRLIGAGQLAVGPRRLAPAARACWRASLDTVLADPTVTQGVQRVGRALDPADAATVQSDIEAVLAQGAGLASMIREERERLRR